ncbi:MAG TPA: 2-amino-4-hydroxy-6-hydroxymethyldihydropteridine diphosphokinase [Bryobacteraceae bacterium]|nr:2-amino-4-hydroxy-6-hydroxymethyldihydropteridine diphosphokinase [Bryobacteraceae bacterium]
MKTVYLGLGSNIGDREKNLASALEHLSAPNLRVARVSSIYETEPIDLTAQRWFLNLVAEVETDLFPVQLLTRTLKIERSLGRVRTIKNGPRTIDIDILLYGKIVIHSATLEVPHPRMAERRFVLAPLAELAPELRHPLTHRSIRQMLDDAPAQAVRRLQQELPGGALP